MFKDVLEMQIFTINFPDYSTTATIKNSDIAQLILIVISCIYFIANDFVENYRKIKSRMNKNKQTFKFWSNITKFFGSSFLVNV
jgi:hypothetical protein